MKTRRTFLKASALAITTGGVTASCVNLASYVFEYEVHAAIDNDPQHEGRLTKEDLASTQKVIINIRGSSAHGHWVEISVDHLRRIKTGDQVTIESSVDVGHTHNVTFNA